MNVDSADVPITKCTYSANTTLERLQIESAKLARRSSPDVASCQGAMTVRFDGATLVAEAANGELVAIKCGFSMAEGWQVYFELFRVILPKPKYAAPAPAVSRPASRDAQRPLRAGHLISVI